MTSGILTAADAAYFQELRLMLRSLAEWPSCPVTVYDLGLTDDQRMSLEDDGIGVQFMSNAVAERRRFGGWAWKPWAIAESPYDLTAYLDPDTVLLAPPEELLAFGHARLAVFAHVGFAVVGTRNPLQLYELLPTKVPPSRVAINTGVLVTCVKRDANVLGSWMWLLDHARENPAINDLVRYSDQGALLWALHATDSLASIVHDARWNRSADGLYETPGVDERRTYKNDGTLIEQVRRNHPDMALVHWWGRPKLSEMLQAVTA